MSECMCLLTEWLGKSEMKREEVESLVENLSFIATCVRPGWLLYHTLGASGGGIDKKKIQSQQGKDLL